MSTFSTLLRKDWRVYRVAVVGTLLLFVLVYVLCVAVAITRSLMEEGHRFSDELPDLMTGAGVFGMLITTVMTSVFGGMAFAEERARAWADFVTLLPPRRDHAVVSKVCVSAGFLSVCYGFHLAVALYSNGLSSHPGPVKELVLVFGNSVASGAILFGVAWGLSCFLSSGAISAPVRRSHCRSPTGCSSRRSLKSARATGRRRITRRSSPSRPSRRRSSPGRSARASISVALSRDLRRINVIPFPFLPKPNPSQLRVSLANNLGGLEILFRPHIPGRVTVLGLTP